VIILTVDVSLLDKTRFKRITRKNGKEAVFCELILVESKDDKYGNDYMVKESATKEEREARKQFSIVGNAKIVGQRPATSAPAQAEGTDDGDSVPF